MKNTQSKPYLEMIATLKNKLNPKLAQVIKHNREGLVIAIENFYLIIVANAKTAEGHRVSAPGVELIFDPDYAYLKAVLQDDKKLPDKDFNGRVIQSILKALSMNKKTSKAGALEAYNDNHLFSVKCILSKYFKLDLKPQNEYFLFGDDEIQSRYKTGDQSLLKKTISQVVILDKGAFIKERNGKRYIAMDYGMSYRDEKYFYPEVKIAYARSTKEESDSVRHNPKTETYTYYKTVLPKNADLSKSAKVPYCSANNLKLTLKRKGNTFSFYDKKGLITIDHPDLLICLLK